MTTISGEMRLPVSQSFNLFQSISSETNKIKKLKSPEETKGEQQRENRPVLAPLWHRCSEEIWILQWKLATRKGKMQKK